MRIGGIHRDSPVHAPPNLRPYQIGNLAILACSETPEVNELSICEADLYAVDPLGVRHLLRRRLILLLKVIAQHVDLRGTGILDDAPHKSIEIRPVDVRIPRDLRTIAGPKALNDLSGVHTKADYTYLSFENKPHMSCADGHYPSMHEKQLRQVLANCLPAPTLFAGKSTNAP